jgi:hypothetical protein
MGGFEKEFSIPFESKSLPGSGKGLFVERKDEENDKR